MAEFRDGKKPINFTQPLPGWPPVKREHAYDFARGLIQDLSGKAEIVHALQENGWTIEAIDNRPPLIDWRMSPDGHMWIRVHYYENGGNPFLQIIP